MLIFLQNVFAIAVAIYAVWLMLRRAKPTAHVFWILPAITAALVRLSGVAIFILLLCCSTNLS